MNNTLKNLVLFLLTLLIYQAQAQIISGKIIDKKTKSPLPYSNIGIMGKSIGGTSNSEGVFRIDLSEAVKSDTLVISYIGYASQKYLVGQVDFSQNHSYKLTPTSRVLKNVVIKSTRKPVTFGPKSFIKRGYTGWGGFNQSLKGAQRGVLVHLDSVALQLGRAKITMHDCTYDSSLFRLHIYTSTNGMPGAELLTDNLLFTVYRNQKKVTVDLQPQDLMIEGSVFISVEWIESWSSSEERHMLSLAMKPAKGKYIVREAPNDQWKVKQFRRTPAISVEGYVYQLGSNSP